MLVPLDRRSTYDDTRSFAEQVAGVIAAAIPAARDDRLGEVEAEGRADRRQPERARARRSPRSTRCARTRARRSRRRFAGSEVTTKLDPAAFTMGAVLDRVARHGDLFEGVLKTRQSLSKALRELR